MIRFIIRKYLDADRPDGRKRVGIILGATGIFFDLLLFGVKHLAGVLSGSVAVKADAFNNLADAGAHIAALLAFPFGAGKPSRRFPFGFGRLEYFSGLVIAGAILIVGEKMILSSAAKILHPEAVESSPAVIAILLFSIAVKWYMFRYNRAIGERIDSAGLKSVAVDSVCDCCATAAIILSILIRRATGLNIDGWAGLAVAGCILCAGAVAARDSLAPLLGMAVKGGAQEKLAEILNNCGIRVAESVAVHDYGPGCKLVTMRIAEEITPERLARLKQMIGDELQMESVIEIKNPCRESNNRPPNRQE